MIEVLVSLLLSVIVVLAMMATYGVTVNTTAESREGARIDGNINLGLLTADRLLQDAGFGLASLTNSYGTRFQVYSGSTAVALSSGSASGDTLVWQNGTNTCLALGKVSGATSGMSLFGGSTGFACTMPMSTLSIPTGTTQQVIIAVNPATINSAPNANVVTYTAQTSPSGCLPFGVQGTSVGGGAYTVTVSVNSYAGSTSTTANTLTDTVCMFNLH